MQKLEDEPDIEFNNFARVCDGLREDEFNDAHFAAWCEGRTGYPMVDACMRSLIATGWLNFRMRAMLVSFASYHLWLHWRPTGLFLARQFLDYEPASTGARCRCKAALPASTRCACTRPPNRRKTRTRTGCSYALGA